MAGTSSVVRIALRMSLSFRSPRVESRAHPGHPALDRCSGSNDAYGSVEIPFVVSVTVMSVKLTVIGGLQSGVNVAVTDRLKFALPFWTGKSSAAETLSLFTAFG